MIDLSIYFFKAPELWINQILLGIISILMVGLGSGIYLIARLGPGPRDGLKIRRGGLRNLVGIICPPC